MLDAGAIEKRARQILREGRELSPGAYGHGYLDPEELDRILTSGARDAMTILRPLERLSRVKAYRALVLERELDLEHLGVYWALDEAHAEPYWGVARGEGPIIEVLLKASVARGSVDWLTSAALLALRGPDELELRVRSGARVFLESVDGVPYNEWARA